MASHAPGPESPYTHAYYLTIEKGVKRRENPYKRWSPKYREWDRGWKHGMRIREKDAKRLNKETSKEGSIFWED